MNVDLEFAGVGFAAENVVIAAAPAVVLRHALLLLHPAFYGEAASDGLEIMMALTKRCCSADSPYRDLFAAFAVQLLDLPTGYARPPN